MSDRLHGGRDDIWAMDTRLVQPGAITEKWTLDSTGKNLVAERVIDAMGQQFSLKLSFNKQR